MFLPAIVSDSEGRVIYMPNENVNGFDTLRYFARDSKGTDSDVTHFSINITIINQAPSVASSSVTG